jgi:hypothetical protein
MCTAKGVRAKKSGKKVSWQWSLNSNVIVEQLLD